MSAFLLGGFHFFFFLCFRSLGTSGCRRTTIFTWNHFQKCLIADFPVSPWGGCTWWNDSTTNFHIFVWTGLMFLVMSPRVFWTRPEEEKFCFRRTDRNISGGPDLGCACVCLHRFYSSLVFFFFFLRIEPVRVFFFFIRSLSSWAAQTKTDTERREQEEHVLHFPSVNGLSVSRVWPCKGWGTSTTLKDGKKKRNRYQRGRFESAEMDRRLRNLIEFKLN